MSEQFTRRKVNTALIASAVALASGHVGAFSHIPRVLFDFAIAGGYYHGLEQVLPRLSAGMKLQLRREAGNSYDTHAVGVWFDNKKLGYIPREANRPVAELMDNNVPLNAHITAMMTLKHLRDVPDDLVFTSVTNGDPIVRLVAVQLR